MADNLWSDMPPGVDADTGAFIPPPPNATYMTDPTAPVQGRTVNGTPYPHFASYLPSASTPLWPTSLSTPYPPWAAPVTPIPAGTFGLPSPASFGPRTPVSGYFPPSPLPYTPAMPAMATPYFNAPNGGALHLTSSPSLDAYGYPLSRTPSSGRKRRLNNGDKSPSARSEYQLWKGPDAYSSKNLAKRPRDWRPDYNPRSKIASYISLGRHPSDIPEFTDPVKRTLNSLLLFKTTETTMYWNLRQPPSSVDFMQLNRASNQIDLVQLATSPPADQMRLSHPKLPWYIDVFKRHPNGITIEDVLYAIHTQLSTQIRPRHYYNEELDEVLRAVLQAAYLSRCGNTQELLNRGILQVDFLADKYVLLGLVKGKHGMWEMKTGEEG